MNSGFVRRRLGGEDDSHVDRRHFFAGAYTVLWTSITVVADRPCRRGVAYPFHDNACLLVPVLPFAFSYI